jgi:4-amino-4-deoxy-L-arabinose transferase-like glycosyltransferase
VTARAAAAVLVLILAGSFALKLHHLDHAALKPLDEVFHAIVARNFLKHPLTPTLVDRPYLAYDSDDWLNNHIWLHKPPMAMWQIAVSFGLLGMNTLALRLPSAILSTFAVWLTYLIGVRLLDRTAALIAAALQAFNPVILMLVQGYVFSDHVDISLLFWTELSIYFLVRCLAIDQKRRWLFPIFCGIAQGLAFLSKSFPALIVTGLALVAWYFYRPRFGARSFLSVLVSTLATLLPWMLWTAIRFPHEFHHENLEILHHLSQNVENWAAPWDQMVFNYWISIFHVYYIAILAAAVVFVLRAWQARNRDLALILAWALGVAAPNLLATSKPMTATLIGWPAAWLMLGYVISLALRGDRLALGTWLASMLLALFFLNRDSIPRGGENWGQIPTAFAAVMRQHLWVLWYVLIALACGVVANRLAFSRKALRSFQTIAVASGVLLALVWWRGDHPRGYGIVAFEVTQIDTENPNFTKLGEFAARLPDNSAILVDEQFRFENKLVEFAADRSCYSATEQNWSQRAQELEQAGALPYLLTPVSPPLPVVFVDLDPHRTLYACTPAAEAAIRP